MHAAFDARSTVLGADQHDGAWAQHLCLQHAPAEDHVRAEPHQKCSLAAAAYADEAYGIDRDASFEHKGFRNARCVDPLKAQQTALWPLPQTRLFDGAFLEGV